MHQFPKLSHLEERLVRIGVHPTILFDEYGTTVMYRLPEAFEGDKLADARQRASSHGLHEKMGTLCSYREVIHLLPTPEEVADINRRQTNVRIFNSLKSDEKAQFADPADCATAHGWWAEVSETNRAVWAKHAQEDRKIHHKRKS
jgi:hypothetical protein